MSGYPSKSAAVTVAKATIPNVAATINLPTDLKAYYVDRIILDVAESRGHRYGWGLDYDVRNWEDSLRKNLRKSFSN